ncbi:MULTISPECIES: class I SAM-dependent methyltransferase [unclassified Crossiella]|uniref:class I SAM-dependent methyltransferase n=1 Tax=unclassified Crossiella TaxID=2620835 RepID=UPI001FFECE0E|nr:MULTISPECIES: class I SAM-dependent methyltransferase [unclassified Crossiella]MCK2244143.1 hypothetical protein [Crossiella sp. S99.2]MCK2257947.1 hypothetical protein [Crossiella sp. S99.1]
MTVTDVTRTDRIEDNPVLAQDWRGRAPLPMSADSAFNGYIAANVLFALNRLGVLAEFESAGFVDVSAFCAEHSVDEPMFRSFVHAARSFGHVSVDGDKVTLTEAGREVVRMHGFFTWAVGGYNEVFANAGPLALGERTYSHDVLRDEGMVALGSAQCDRELMAHILDGVLAEVDFSVLADLGSGTSARVSRVVAGRPGARGLGLDISGPATEIAHRTIAAAGMADRVSAIQADVLDVVLAQEHREAIAEVDAVMSFFLLHDLLANPATRGDILPRMREVFPKARTFLLADTVIRPRHDDDATLPVFSTGFELAHALMGVPLHTKEAYEQLFAEAGLHLRRAVPFGAPHSWLFVLEAR